MKASPPSPHYENFLLVFCAVLNSLAGIVVDLYAPSLPAIGRAFHLTSAAAQNTIVFSIIGYAVGQLFFGFMADWRGRRPAILFGLSVFVLGSVCAMSAHGIATLLLGRVLQGFAAGSTPVVTRAILIDTFKGSRLDHGFVYLSVAFAVGLITGPFAGGAIQQHFGWRWNFVLYSVYSLVLLLATAVALRESMPRGAQKTPRESLAIFQQVAKKPAFIIYAFQLGCCFIGFTLWNQIGPEIVQRVLHHAPVVFGLTALAAGCAYLAGSFANRLLPPAATAAQRMTASLAVFLVGVLVLAAGGASLKLAWIVPGIMLCTSAQGLVFPNVSSRAILLFPDRAGFAASLQGFGMLMIGAAGLALAAHLPQRSGYALAGLYGTLWILTAGALALNFALTLRSKLALRSKTAS